MSDSNDPRNRSRGGPFSAQPRNVGVDEYGRRVVGPTSAQESAQRNQQTRPGGALYQSRALSAGGGLDGFYAKNPHLQTRQSRVQGAQMDGSFDRIQQDYNNANPTQWMDRQGSIGQRPAEPAAAPTAPLPGALSPAAQPTREDRVAQAKTDGSFGSKRTAYNQANPTQWMDESGRIGQRSADGLGAPGDGSVVQTLGPNAKVERTDDGARIIHSAYGKGWANSPGTTTRRPTLPAGSLLLSSYAQGPGPAPGSPAKSKLPPQRRPGTSALV